MKSYTAEETELLPDSEETEWENESGNGAGRDTITVDFEALRAINPDIVAWIRIAGTEVDYPVVQGEDNGYYLTHTFTGAENSAGTLFLDYRNAGDFTDSISMIYGHNRKDGSMFGNLKAFLDEAYFSEHGEIQLYLPSGLRIYQITACEKISASDGLYQFYGSDFAENGENSESNIIVEQDTGQEVESGWQENTEDGDAEKTLENSSEQEVRLAEDSGQEQKTKELILSTCTSDSDTRLIIRGELTGAE
ncbi:MAG: class B sortase [Lachnospiraceae bacterium]|nr:class B sortase [Lachnospiraceae bacterium]